MEISIHALLAESDWLRCWQLAARDISIHALLAESDGISSTLIIGFLAFLSTLSLRRATRRSVKLFRQNYISIHALLAESDTWIFQFRKPYYYFYPRSPCGERRGIPKVFSSLGYFYPRSPCGERRSGRCRYWESNKFLSTLSLRRATAKSTPEEA